MASLAIVLNSIYGNSNHYSQSAYQRTPETKAITETRFMEIPIRENTFEIPLLALNSFMNALRLGDRHDSLIAELYSTGRTSQFRSLDAIVKDVLSTPFYKRLVKVTLPNVSNVYYSTFGALFDADLKPLMMMSWIMERTIGEDRHYMYSFKKPLLRIDPVSFVSKEDPVQKLLSGRLLSNALENSMYPPRYYELRDYFTTDRFAGRDYKVKVEIDECPFILKSVDVPSISVTNESLLQLAADNIHEVMQL